MRHDNLRPRNPQTRVKHTILQKYAGHWGGIILQGLSGRNICPHLIFVDYNAGFGRYLGEREDWEAGYESSQPVYGSPIIGIRALDALVEHARTKYGIELRVNAILVEKDARKFAELKHTLEMAKLSHRVVETQEFSRLGNNQIAVWLGDSTLLASRILAYTQASALTYSLHMIDPYGASGVPLKHFVAPIISAKRHDVILYMPYYDLHKKSGLITKPNLNEDEINRVGDFDRMFNDAGAWQKLVTDLEPDLIWCQPEFDQMSVGPISVESSRLALAQEREQRLIRHYKSQLEATDPNIIVKSIRLPFPERDLTMYYLYLTTHDPTGALMMNEGLAKADLLSQELRQRLRGIMKNPHAQLTLFEVGQTEAPPMERPSTEDIAREIARLVEYRAMTRKDVYRALAHELYFPSEIDRALKWLREQDKVFFDPRLTNKTFIRTRADNVQQA